MSPTLFGENVAECDIMGPNEIEVMAMIFLPSNSVKNDIFRPFRGNSNPKLALLQYVLTHLELSKYKMFWFRILNRG